MKKKTTSTELTQEEYVMTELKIPVFDISNKTIGNGIETSIISTELFGIRYNLKQPSVSKILLARSFNNIKKHLL